MIYSSNYDMEYVVYSPSCRLSASGRSVLLR